MPAPVELLEQVVDLLVAGGRLAVFFSHLMNGPDVMPTYCPVELDLRRSSGSARRWPPA